MNVIYRLRRSQSVDNMGRTTDDGRTDVGNERNQPLRRAYNRSIWGIVYYTRVRVYHRYDCGYGWIKTSRWCLVKYSKVYVDLYSALRITTCNVLTLPVCRRWSSLASSFSQAISKHCETTDTGRCITRYACLLFQRSPGTHSSLPEGRLRLSRPGCLVQRRGGLPVKRRSPTQALTRPPTVE